MGKLIVFEGTDGSGKATQTQMLCDRLDKMGRIFKKLNFPRYENESSALVRLYLNGNFGKHPDDVNAYAASAFFAVDRYASFKEDWEQFYRDGGLIITDRYTTSNAVHQAPKLPKSERYDFTDWLFDFEYNLMGIPRPDLVIYLDMPTETAAALRKHREEENGTSADIHEKDSEYLSRCRKTSLKTAERYGWETVNCARDGVLRSADDIHEEIYGIVVKLLEVR